MQVRQAAAVRLAARSTIPGDAGEYASGGGAGAYADDDVDVTVARRAKGGPKGVKGSSSAENNKRAGAVRRKLDPIYGSRVS